MQVRIVCVYNYPSLDEGARVRACVSVCVCVWLRYLQCLLTSEVDGGKL